MRRWKSYQVSVTFRAPLRFAYRWCTSYTSEDAKYGGEDRTIGLERRIIRRDSREVVFENLYRAGRGWGWERHVVTLHPPNRWHSEGKGNYQESVLDYELAELPGNRTRFNMRWRSRPIGLAKGRRASKELVEGYVARLWRLRAKALEHEYRKSHGEGERPSAALSPARERGRTP